MAQPDQPSRHDNRPDASVIHIPGQAPPGTHATEFLANERTFLAWVRTSIAVMTLGFAVTRFDTWMGQIGHGARGAPPPAAGWPAPMGVAMIVLGGLLPILAAWRYHAVNRQIEHGAVRADRVLIGFVTVLVVALATMFVLYFSQPGVR